MNRVYERGRRLLQRRRFGRIISLSVGMAVAASGMTFAVGAKHFMKPDRNVEKPAHDPQDQDSQPSKPDHAIGSPKPKPETPPTKPPTSQPKPTEKPDAKPTEMPDEEPTEKPDPTPEPSKTLECRNSTNPDCGPFYWDPKPDGNAPLTVTLTVLTANPQPGQQVQYRVVADDPDAWIDAYNVKIMFGDGTYERAAMPGDGCTGRYGPWTPPAKKHGHVETTFTHTYAEAGSYQVKVYAKSSPGCYQPYQSYDEAYETVTVAGASPSPEPAPQ